MAALLPNGEQVFLDANGRPLAGGLVYMYIPGTTTPKLTWQDAAQSTANSNPILLDAAGRAVIYGIGPYRQLVTDFAGVLQWDAITGGGALGTPGGHVYASDFGLRAGGSDAAAIQAAINAAATMGSATVYLGPGPIQFNAGDQIVWPLNAIGISLKGDGPQTTVINISGNLATDVLVLTAGNPAHCQIRDLGFACSGIGTGGALIHFINNYSFHVENVRMAGGFYNGVAVGGGNNQYLGTIRDLICPSAASANACIILGDDTTGLVQAIYIDTCKLAASAFGVYMRNCSGVSIVATETLEHGQAGFITSPSSGEQTKGLQFDNCIADSCAGTGINIGHSGGNVSFVSIAGTWSSSNQVGIAIAPNPNANNVSIVGCQIHVNRQSGIINFGSNAVLLVNNLLAGNGTQSPNSFDAISSLGGINNVINGNYIGSAFGFPAAHRYGIALLGASDYCVVTGNTTGGPSGTGSINNAATGTHNVVSNNTGT